ncbi:MAG: hypothetical protein KC766_25380 [Myxococcales bacterium]|nr:hypothetical protein [Myxococcales bacterium]
MSSSHSKTPLVALGFASCQLPLLVAVAVGWWTAWAGLAAGVGVSVLFSVAWARRARQQLFLLGIAAGLVFSIVGASLTLPSLRHLVGALPSYQLGTPYDSRADTPMAVELVSIQGGAPRTDLLYQGDVLRTRSEGGTSYLYSVVAPIAPVDWEPGRPVPAWAICEVSREGKGKQASAERECKQLLGHQPASYEHETFDADLPNAPMVQQAMQRHHLTQAPHAPIFVLSRAEDAWPGLIAPIVLMLLSLGALVGVVNKHVETLGRANRA